MNEPELILLARLVSERERAVNSVNRCAERIDKQKKKLVEHQARVDFLNRKIEALQISESA